MKRKIIETKLVFISQREKKLWKFAIFEEYYKPKFVRMVSFFDEREEKEHINRFSFRSLNKYDVMFPAINVERLYYIEYFTRSDGSVSELIEVINQLVQSVIQRFIVNHSCSGI